MIKANCEVAYLDSLGGRKKLLQMVEGFQKVCIRFKFLNDWGIQ